jgi:hypothetical protein
VSEILDLDRTVALLSEALNGDAARINELRHASQQQLHLAGQALGGHLRLARTSVLRVVKEWHASGLTDEQVRWWALLMTIGGFPEDWSPYGWHLHHTHQPVDIDYSDEVSEVLSRLRDLGDFDDMGRSCTLSE